MSVNYSNNRVQKTPGNRFSIPEQFKMQILEGTTYILKHKITGKDYEWNLSPIIQHQYYLSTRNYYLHL